MSGILLSIVPGALTTQAPHAMRIFSIIPFVQIISSIGLVWLFDMIRRKGTKYYSIIIGIMMVSIIHFFRQYFQIFPVLHADSFQLPLSNSIRFLIQNEDEYPTILVSNTDALYQSYMYYLYYRMFDPDTYQQSGGTISGGYSERHTIGRIQFRKMDTNTDLVPSPALIIGNIAEFQPGTGFHKVFLNTLGEEKIGALIL
jgi:hypothetical protein